MMITSKNGEKKNSRTPSSSSTTSASSLTPQDRAQRKRELEKVVNNINNKINK